MEGGFQKFPQLFVAYGYYAFKHDISADQPDVQEGKPDYAKAHLSEFFAKARCPPVLAPSEVAAVKV